MKKTIYLDMLNFVASLPESVQIHDERYIEKEEFYACILDGSEGKALSISEIMDIPYIQEDGAYFGYYLQKEEKRVLHAHYYVSKLSERIYPVNRFVRAHEQTHLLKKEILSQRDEWYSHLKQQGYNVTEISTLKDEETIADFGGLCSLCLDNIKVGNNSDSAWRTFSERIKRRAGMESFRRALALHLEHSPSNSQQIQANQIQQ